MLVPGDWVLAVTPTLAAGMGTCLSKHHRAEGAPLLGYICLHDDSQHQLSSKGKTALPWFGRNPIREGFSVPANTPARAVSVLAKTTHWKKCRDGTAKGPQSLPFNPNPGSAARISAKRTSRNEKTVSMAVPTPALLSSDLYDKGVDQKCKRSCKSGNKDHISYLQAFL